jgi:hypothetical protein
LAISLEPRASTNRAPREIDGSPFPDSWGALHSDILMHPVDVSDWPVKIDSRRQLFVDDYLIAASTDVRRTLHQLRKHPANPVMAGETAWEGGPRWGPVLAYVLRDDQTGRFRLWYRSRVKYQANGRTYSDPNLYAESADGLHWERPNLGLYEWEGSKDNNIILQAGDMRGLIHEPHDTAAPWKGIWEHKSAGLSPDGVTRDGYYLYTSQDAIRWERAFLSVPHGARRAPSGDGARQSPLPLPRLGDTGHVRWDSMLETYVCDAKGTVPREGGDKVLTAGQPGGDGHHRFRLQMESDDLIHWSRPRVVAFPDQRDLDAGTIGFYGLLGTNYESLWIGYLRTHRLDPWKRVDVQLAVSRDGRTWSRACDREVFLPLGPEDSWEPDYSEINHAGPILVNDKLWFFYRGSILERHRGTGPDLQKGLGLATLRRDGFASLTAGANGGRVVTRPLTFEGKHLHVNAAVKSGGHIRVALLDSDGAPIPGFTAEDCAPISGDATDLAVTWSGGALPPPTPYAPRRLAFTLTDADLYAFWID